MNPLNDQNLEEINAGKGIHEWHPEGRIVKGRHAPEGEQPGSASGDDDGTHGPISR